MVAFLAALGTVFLAELGDKSQLLALALAARFRPAPVVAGLALASVLTQGLAATVGAVLWTAVPSRPLDLAAGAAFLLFAVWTLVTDRDEELGVATEPRRDGSAFLTAAAAFLVAEIGDKTMLATVTLAARLGLLATWAGASLGMVAASALAVLVGRRLGRRLPVRALRLGAAALFAAFGVGFVVAGLT